jgi:hypothetical protein
MSEDRMNTVFHLAGEQPLPVYMGIMQFDCSRHILGVTNRTRAIGETVRNVCSGAEREVELLELDAYDMQTARRSIAECVASRPDAQWGFNLTGGTKPMFAAAYQAAQELRATPFYIETTNRTCDWLDGSARREPLRPTLSSVETFIRLAGYSVLRSPDGTPSPLDSPEGLRLLETMWIQRQKLQGWYRTIGRYTKYPGIPFNESPTSLKGLKVSAALKGPAEGYAGTLAIGDKKTTLAPWPDLAQFICGGWLEDYMFHKLQTLRAPNRVTDIIENLVVTAGDDDQADPFQEFDIALSDGFALTIVECKAGDLDQGHVQKLENLARRFGGHFGRGVLVAGRADRLETVRERVERSTTVCAISAAALLKNPASVMECRPGAVVMR